MSRHGYTEDDMDWALICWRGQVASAIRGRRGQAMLKSLLAALDAMKHKRLIHGDLITEEGDCCAIGALLRERETPNARNMHEDNEAIAEELDVSECLVREIEYENDEGVFFPEEEEARWTRMRKWTEKYIVVEVDLEK